MWKVKYKHILEGETTYFKLHPFLWERINRNLENCDPHFSTVAILGSSYFYFIGMDTLLITLLTLLRLLYWLSSYCRLAFCLPDSFVEHGSPRWDGASSSNFPLNPKTLHWVGREARAEGGSQGRCARAAPPLRAETHKCPQRALNNQ